MAEWKRRTNWAWPDWTYFFGSMVIVPMIDIGLGSPLQWLNDPHSSRYGKASWVLECCIVLVVLNRLDPIGRLLKIPGDAALKAPLPRSAQAAICLWIGVLLGVFGTGGGMWVYHLAAAPGFDFEKNHEGLSFLLTIALLFSFVCLLCGFILWFQERRERLQKARIAAR